jgi:glycosyltransferase 2 family protein
VGYTLISPTPGGSGVAEFVFSGFLGEFIPSGLTPALGLMWRIISYYPYLFIGAIILPNWLKRVYSKKHKKVIGSKVKDINDINKPV